MSPQRVADAANIHPYPFVVRQERLPPDNAGRERNDKSKKSKPRPRAERNPRQEEEIRFNTGPRNLRGSPVNRGGRRPFRMPGRHDRGYDDHGVPDYPPPSFQEATMSTPPLSACSSTTTLVPTSIPAVLVPENIPEIIVVPVVPPIVETSNQTVASDQGSDSDESLQIIDKNFILDSDDLPKGLELEKRIRTDWKSRRGIDFPGPSSDLSPKQGENIVPDRGRSTLRTPERLTIDPDACVIEVNNQTSPTSPAKRRFVSLSPLRTILSPRLMIDPDRPMSAHPSPYSSPYPISSRNIFFRSSTSLATSSMSKLSLASGKNDNSAPRKLFGKGKEKLDAWEVLEEAHYPDEFEALGDYPSSLMSAVRSLKLSVNMGNSPSRSQSFNVGVSAPGPPRTKHFPNGSQGSAVHEAQSLVSFQAHQSISLKDRISTSGSLLDRKPLRSTAAASTATSTSITVPVGADSSPARPVSPVTHPRVPSPSPAPSVSKRTVLPIHPSPLRVDSNPNVAIEDQASSSTIYQQALDTPLPATPVCRTCFDVVVSGADQETDISARPVPDILNDSFSDGDVYTCRSTPPTSLSLRTANCLSQINLTEEPMTPNRHHYTGRPLPRPPPSVTRSNIDSTFAPEVSVYDADSSSTRCPEGLLINLDDTSLDDCSASGASTPISDGAGARLRPHLHLPITPSSSATELTMETASQRSALSNSTARGPASPTSEVNGPFEPTELDLLVSRLADGVGDGSDYETLLLVSEVIGPASPTHAHIVPHPPSTFQKANANANISLIGQIEVKRRRETKDGRVKLKLSLFDVGVNKCGICLSQFKDGDKAGLTSVCQHAFHENCLARWLARNKTCPLCRVPLDVDVR